MREEGWGWGRSSQGETAMQELIYRGRVLAWRSQRPGAQLSREGLSGVALSGVGGAKKEVPHNFLHLCGGQVTHMGFGPGGREDSGR